MKYVIFAVSIVLTLSSCQNSNQKIEKLFSERGISTTDIIKVDSIMDFPDSYLLFLESLEQDEIRNREFEKVMIYASSLSDEEKKDPDFQRYMQIKKDELLGMINQSKELCQKAATKTLKNQLEERNLEFMGWKIVDNRADSVYTYYVSVDIKEIYGIERQEKE